MEPQTLDPIPTPYKLYSRQAILLATFLGTPLAAGVLIRKNFIALGSERKGRNALAISIVATALLFIGLLSLPPAIIDRIPNMVIPLAYLGITHLIVERIQGKALAQHQELQGAFYSKWRAAGIGLLAIVVLLPAIFAYAWYGPQGFDANAYDQGIAEFQENETEAMQLYDLLDKNDITSAISFIRVKGIPLWERNVRLIEELNRIEGLYPELREQNRILARYSELRVESYQLIEKALVENTAAYDSRIEDITAEIDALLGQL